MCATVKQLRARHVVCTLGPSCPSCPWLLFRLMTLLFALDCSKHAKSNWLSGENSQDQEEPWSAADNVHVDRGATDPGDKRDYQ